MSYLIPEAESLAKRGLIRRAATIYKLAIRDAHLDDKQRDFAIYRYNSLLNQAEKQRVERAGSLTMNNDPDFTIFNAMYSGPSSVLTHWGCKV